MFLFSSVGPWTSALPSHLLSPEEASPTHTRLLHQFHLSASRVFRTGRGKCHIASKNGPRCCRSPQCRKACLDRRSGIAGFHERETANPLLHRSDNSFHGPLYLETLLVHHRRVTRPIHAGLQTSIEHTEREDRAASQRTIEKCLNLILHFVPPPTNPDQFACLAIYTYNVLPTPEEVLPFA